LARYQALGVRLVVAGVRGAMLDDALRDIGRLARYIDAVAAG
jgi:hypothetical protein